MLAKFFWALLILASCLLLLLYLYFTISPGGVDPATWNYFARAEVEAGRQYHFSSQLTYALSFLMETLLLIWLVFGGKTEIMERWVLTVARGRGLLGVLLFFLMFWVIIRLVNLPFSLYSGYYLQHQWGFSTQGLAGWWTDYFKGAAIDLVLSAVGVFLLFWATGVWPGRWWLLAGAFLAVWIVIESFLWPVVVAPLFNHFEPVQDREIVAMVERLAERSGVAVDQVLVMDASSRTTKANAYFAGVGRTKRVVLYDNLIKDYPPQEVEAVIAHEMAHWKKGHVIRGVLYGILGTFMLFLALFLVLHGSLALPGSGPYPPRAWALMLLFFLLISFVSSPLQNSISRGMEIEADQLAVKLTANPAATIGLHLDLARKNLSDVSPATFIEWFSYTHPSALHRIRNIEALSTAYIGDRR